MCVYTSGSLPSKQRRPRPTLSHTAILSLTRTLTASFHLAPHLLTYFPLHVLVIEFNRLRDHQGNGAKRAWKKRKYFGSYTIVERTQKLLDYGVISEFHASVNCSSVGLPITAMIRMSVVGDILPRLSILLQSLPEVVECYRETGSDSFIMKVCVESVEHLEHLIDRLTPFGMTQCAFIAGLSALRPRIRKPGWLWLTS